MLEHGGRLRDASRRYGIPLADWLDLSTGINPHGYPVLPPPGDSWLRLPEDDDGLEEAAAAFYGGDALLPVAGSQAAIQALPAVLPAQRVALLQPCYAEHRHAWRARTLIPCTPASLDAAVDEADLVLLVHPNNPDATRFPQAQLEDWLQRLTRRGGWLVVDEAFMDATPEDSLLSRAGTPGLVVLRSLGKFFGLAGARVGFVFAPRAVREALAERLGPWGIAGPARWAARTALADRGWQGTMRQQLKDESLRLQTLLARHGLIARGCTALFCWVPHPQAARLHDALARQGILTRRFADPAGLRFGLPAHAADWARLDAALTRARPA